MTMQGYFVDLDQLIVRAIKVRRAIASPSVVIGDTPQEAIALARKYIMVNAESGEAIWTERLRKFNNRYPLPQVAGLKGGVS